MKPAKGVTQYGIDYPEGNALFQKELKENLKPEIKVVEVDTTQDDPTAIYRIMTIDGKETNRKRIVLSELSN